MSGPEQRSGERRAAATGHWLRPAVLVAVEAVHLPGREFGAGGLELAAAYSVRARQHIVQRVSEGGGRLIASLQDQHQAQGQPQEAAEPEPAPEPTRAAARVTRQTAPTAPAAPAAAAAPQPEQQQPPAGGDDAAVAAVQSELV